PGALPPARHHGDHLLPLAAEVRRPPGERGAPPQGPRGREPTAQATRGRPGAQSPGAEGSTGKRLMTAAERRGAVRQAMAAAGISERRACRFTGFSRSGQRYTTRRPARGEIRERLHTLATLRPRWGYRRLHLLLRREGHEVKRKLTYRLYREEVLGVRRRERKRVAVTRTPMAAPGDLNEGWSVGLLSEADSELP